MTMHSPNRTYTPYHDCSRCHFESFTSAVTKAVVRLTGFASVRELLDSPLVSLNATDSLDKERGYVEVAYAEESCGSLIDSAHGSVQ